MQNITIHPTNNQSSPQQQQHFNHHSNHQQPSNAPPSLTILNNGNSNDSNNNLSSIKSENTTTNNNSNNNRNNNKIIIKKTSTTTITTNHSSIILTSSGVKTIVGRYNRRNNPELEKRRIHHCDFIGKWTVIIFLLIARSMCNYESEKFHTNRPSLWKLKHILELFRFSFFRYLLIFIIAASSQQRRRNYRINYRKIFHIYLHRIYIYIVRALVF